MSKHSIGKLARSVFIYGSGDILQKVASFLLIPLYTAFLSPSDFGIVSLIGTTVSILCIVHMLGLDAGVLRYYYDLEESEFKNFLKVIYLFLGCFGCLIAILILTNATWFGQLLFKQPGKETLIRYAMVTFFSMNIVNLFMNLWVSRQESARYTFFSLFNFALITSSVVFFVVYRKEGALGQVKGTALGWGILLIIFCFIIYRYLKTGQPHVQSSQQQLTRLKETMKYGFPFLPHLIMVWLFSGLDVMVLNYMCSLEDVGIFALGARVGMVMFFVTSALNRAWTPFFFGLCKESSADTENGKYFTYVVLALVLILLIMLLFYREILLLMVNQRYIKSLNIVPLFLLAYFFNGLYFIFISPVLYNKKTRYMPVISAITLVFYGCCLYIFIVSGGIYGAACASVLTYLLRFLLAYYFSARDYWFRLEKSRLFKLSICVIIIAGLSFFVQLHSLVLLLICKSGLLLTLFLLLYLSGFLSTAEMNFLKEFVKKVRFSTT